MASQLYRVRSSCACWGTWCVRINHAPRTRCGTFGMSLCDASSVPIPAMHCLYCCSVLQYFMRQSQMDSGDRSSYDDRMKALQLLASVMAEGFQQAAASGAAPYASVAASDASGDHAGAGAGSSSGEVMPQEYRPDAALMDQYFRTIDR